MQYKMLKAYKQENGTMRFFLLLDLPVCPVQEDRLLKIMIAKVKGAIRHAR